MMKTRLAFAAALLVAAGSTVPAQDEAPKTESELVTMEHKTRKRGRQALLQLEGRAQLPDFTVFQIAVHRLEEMYAGGQLIQGPGTSTSGLTRVVRKKFKFDISVESEGGFMVEVNLLNDLQRPDVLKKLEKITPKRKWVFKFDAWDGDIAKELTPALQKLDNLASESMTMIGRFESATETEAGWHAQSKKLTKDGGKLMAKLQKDDVRLLYPAAYSQMFYTMRNLQGTAQFFHWDGGKFAGGKSYHAKAEKIDTFREEDFTYENLKRYMRETSQIAGREFALWAIREIKRAEGQRSLPLTQAINANADHPGVAQYSAQLLEAELDALVDLEKLIRAKP